MRTNIRFWIWIVLGVILYACGGGGSDSPATLSIEISPDPVNLIPGEKVQFTAVVREPSGAVIENPSLSWRSGDDAIVTIDASGLATGVKLGVTSIIASALNQSQNATVGVTSPNQGGAHFNLSGKAFYEDRLFDASGFTGETELKPIRNAVVTAIAIDGFVPIAPPGSTNANGEFSFSGLKNDSRKGGVYIQIKTQTAPGQPTQVQILNNLSEKALSALISTALDDSTGNSFTGVEPTALASSGVGGAFNILDVFSNASELIQQSGPCPTSDGRCNPPLLTAYWEPGSAEGTHYDDLLDAIFILGGGTPDKDADEYDDSVIAHEYGHFLARHFSRDDSPGGQHRINDTAQDIRLAWSEGWGNFFSSAVRQSPLYVDTTEGSSFSFELESYTSPNFPGTGTASLSAKSVYTTNEIAISGVLWDIYDPIAGPLDVNEQHDQLALGFNPIWQTVLKMQKGGTVPLPATMESFQILFNTIAPGSSDTLEKILEERKMELHPDAPDRTGGAEIELKPNGPGIDNKQHHTLYLNLADPVGDEDLIPFNVEPNKTYTVETLNLTNGADTLLTVKNGTRTLFQNDNRDNANYQNCAVGGSGSSNCPPNDKTTLSSSITFTWSGPAAALNAHVQLSPKAPPSAGKLGAYDIQLGIK